MKALLTSAALLSAAVALPTASHAISISPGDLITNQDNIELFPNETYTVSYEPTEKVRISVISVTGAGFNDTIDLRKVLFGINGASTSFDTYVDNGRTSSAEGKLASFVADAPFTFDASAFGTADKVNLDYVFAVDDVAAVPLPAAGGMLLLALGGIGGAAARKKRKAA